MTIEIKEIIVKTTVSKDGTFTVTNEMQLQKIKRELLQQIKQDLTQKEKRRKRR